MTSNIFREKKVTNWLNHLRNISETKFSQIKKYSNKNPKQLHPCNSQKRLTASRSWAAMAFLVAKPSIYAICELLFALENQFFVQSKQGSANGVPGTYRGTWPYYIHIEYIWTDGLLAWGNTPNNCEINAKIREGKPRIKQHKGGHPSWLSLTQQPNN